MAECGNGCSVKRNMEKIHLCLCKVPGFPFFGHFVFLFVCAFYMRKVMKSMTFDTLGGNAQGGQRLNSCFMVKGQSYLRFRLH